MDNKGLFLRVAKAKAKAKAAEKAVAAAARRDSDLVKN